MKGGYYVEFKKILTNEKGISVIETVWVLMIIGMLIAILGPLFRNFLAGSESNPGFAGRIVENQTYGVNEANSDIELTEGCVHDPSLSDITYEECSALN